MAVLVEAISVIVRRDAIEKRFRGKWHEFLQVVPNGTLCTDGELARVGFMSPPDVQEFIDCLVSGGLTFVRNGMAIDISVVDQMRGPTGPTNWLEFAHLSIDGGKKVAACWLFEDERIAHGVHMPASGLTLATPAGWKYEESLSADFQFVNNEEMPEKMKFLRHENGTDVYLDTETNKERYVHRAKT